MLTKNYRMCEYKIIESDSGDLAWEAHGGFGVLQRGRCFRKGQILFMGPAEFEGPGFLKREFLEHLKKLPTWPRTKYYGKALQIRHCNTNTSITKKEMTLWGLNEGSNQARVSHSTANSEVLYRLLGYEITMKADGQMSWKKPSGPLTIKRGTCTLTEDILFIGPSYDVETGVSSQRFFSNLKKLPIWDLTTYYSTKTALCNCNPETSKQKERKGWQSIGRKVNKHPSGKHLKKRMDLKLTDSRLWIRGALFSSFAEKSTIYSVNLIVLIISFTFSHLIGCCKTLKATFYHRKQRSHSV